MDSQKGEDHHKDLALLGHTAADTRQVGTPRAGNLVVRLGSFHTQEVGSHIEVDMPRVLLVAEDSLVGEDTVVGAGTGHMEAPRIHTAHGTQTGPYLDSGKSKHRDRQRQREVSVDTQTVDDSRASERCECSKIGPPKPSNEVTR